MRTIYKYDLHPSSDIEIRMPAGAEFLSCHEQVQMADASFCAWFMVDTDRELETRRYAVIGTGHKIQGPGYKYLGTALVHDGHLVWHLFDMGAVNASTDTTAGES